MTTLTKAMLVALLARPLAHGAEGLFTELDFDEACQQAKNENKLVFIDFYTTWCMPCKVMEKTTFTDAGVITWLSQNTVPIKVDAEKNAKLAERYKVNAYPTLLFAKADGTEMGRMVGSCEPPDFLSESAAIRSGKTPLERADELLKSAGENDPMARMQYADSLARMGKYEEALDAYLWCFEEGNNYMIGFFGVRLSFLLSDIRRLGQDYPPALEALRQLRDAARERVLAEAPVEEKKEKSFWDHFRVTTATTSVPEFAALNDALGEEQDTLRVYDQMRKEHPDWPVVESLGDSVFDQLLAAKRYAEIAARTDLVRKAEQMASLLDRAAALLPEDKRDEMRTMQRESLIEDISQYYEVMLGVGDLESANKLAEQALKLDDGAETYNLLAWHGYLSEKPIEENVTQARKAYELTNGKDAAVLDTFARVLAALNQQDIACTLLRTDSASLTGDHEHRVLSAAMSDLHCHSPK
ncbi:MAG: DUF255 domain-containing protein [Phycisphaerales bacterium]|nr:DUF255 domain-containing protein [Phycisphaerales bacterium]